MLSSDESKSGGKPNQRKGKPGQANRKSEQRNARAAAPQEAKPDRMPDTVDEMVAPADLTEGSAAPSSAVETVPVPPAPTASAEAETAPVDYRILANAYGDYSRTSLEQTRSFFEQLAGVHSLDKALELQTAFARQAYENFATQSQKIGELHQRMAWQRWQRLESLMTGKTAQDSARHG